jgi:glutamate/tyrosine decarboxylase-like PLP-dependent enzyme
MDAAYGGVFLASPELRHKLGNCKDVDSVVWDPHKGLLVPLQACVFLSKHPGLMEACNSTAADYLFHKERKSYDNVLDTGNKSLQCGRILDILKLWMYLKGNGWKGISEQVQREYNLAQYVKKYIESRPESFKLAIEEVESFNVCFWYLPKHLTTDNYPDPKLYSKKLNDVTVLAKKFMIEEGKMLVGYSSTKGSIYFWRTVMSDPYIL